MYLKMLLLLSLAWLLGCETYQPKPEPPVINNSISEVWKVEKPTAKGWLLDGSSLPHWSTIKTPPLIDGNFIFLAYDSLVECRKVETGELVWAAPLTDASDVSPWTSLWGDDLILENGRLYVAGTGFVLCVNSATGARIWKRNYSQDFGREFNKHSQSAEALYVSTHDDCEVIKISKATGEVVWRTKGAALTNEPEYASYAWLGAPAYYEGKVFVTAKYGSSKWQPRVWHDGSAAAIDDATGKIIWTKIIPPPDSSVGYPYPERLQETMAGRSVVPYEGGILFASGHNIVRMDLEGNIVWRRTAHLNGTVNLFTITPVIKDGRMYVLDNTLLSSLDPLTGEIFWTKLFTRRANDEYTFHSPLQVSGNSVYALTDDYRVFGADIVTGTPNYAADLSPHLYAYDKGEHLLLGGVLVTEERIFGIDRQNLYCWRR